ncbi:MAG: hypothetical protein ACPGYT_06640 [Nitrospirales bacterium]
MKKILSALVVLCAIGVTNIFSVQSAPISNKNTLIALGTTILEGTLMEIVGDVYIIMDSAGEDHRIHVDGRTSIIGNVQPGAKVIAEVNNDDHATEVKKVGA